jgi:aminopeptidase N
MLAGLLLLVTLAVPTRTEPVHAAGPAPAASYRLDVTVDLTKASVTAIERVTFRNVVGVPLDTVVFQVAANTMGAFTLSSVTIDGQSVNVALDGSLLEIALARPLTPGGSTDIEIAYVLAVPNEPGRLTATARGMALGYWFPLLAVHRGEWDRRPFVDVGDARFSEVADYDVAITTTTPAQVVATGQRVEQDGRRSRFKASSVRDFAVAISADYVVRKSTVDGVTVEVAAYGEDRAAYFQSRAAEVVRWAGPKLGPYPYPVLTITDTDIPADFFGLEYPSLIMISRAYPVPTAPRGSTVDAIVVHEILHQWFYSLVGNDQIDDPWLDEAFATYLSYAFYREVQPELASAIFNTSIAGGTAAGPVNSSVNDFPSDGPYFGTVYRQGARFLDRLREKMGDGPFWALLREHVDTYRDRIASPRDLLDRAQRLSPTPVGPLIAEYFSYGAFRTATPRTWSIDAPTGTWTGSAAVFVAADFPVTRVQVWLDQRVMADGPANALTLDLSDVEAGSYVLLVKVWDHDQVVFERARRVEIAK